MKKIQEKIKNFAKENHNVFLFVIFLNVIFFMEFLAFLGINSSEHVTEVGIRAIFVSCLTSYLYVNFALPQLNKEEKKG